MGNFLPGVIMATDLNDEYSWLEEVNSQRALSWVREQNELTQTKLAQLPIFKQIQSGILEVLNSSDKIPEVQKIGDYYYNFWRDAEHESGIWRRTTLDEYRKTQPQWEIVLDLDELNKQENENWVWHGAQCLPPDYQRCFINLSRGGADADVSREFDLEEKQWVENGFYRPESKGGLQWIDQDTVFVYTDFGKGSMTLSGYPRLVKLWQRGRPLESATIVYEGQADDMYIAGFHDFTIGYERDFIILTLAFYNDEWYLLNNENKLHKIDVPNSAQKYVHRQWLSLELRQPWCIGETTYVEGSLLVIELERFMNGERDFTVLFTPTQSTSLAQVIWTKSYVVLNILDNVKSRLQVLAYYNNTWVNQDFIGAPRFGTVHISALEAKESDDLWMSVTDYLTPPTLSLVSIGKMPEKLKSTPTFFASSGKIIEQHFVASRDGTRIPYFVVRDKNLVLDGNHPTLLYGYGGFEISLTPHYSGSLGRSWIERGGIYVVANIRGGGEYGPRWHQAALKQNRHRAYEDMAAVAQDLIARGITCAQHLAIQGGSNGGLLAGNMLTQYTELVGAVVIQVPLLDMKRYSHLLAGASWMAEYGDPDTDDWAFIQTFSPYHLFDSQKQYPPVLLTTSTRDDRVHPAHARKMAARMLAAGKDVYYYENIEGGHGGAANNSQAAYMAALAYTFLWQQLKGRD